MYTTRYLIFVLNLISIVQCVEFFIKPLDQDKIQPSKLLLDERYELPMFQSRLLTAQLSLQRSYHKQNLKIIGFRFQIQSTNPDVVLIKKNVQQTTTNNVVLTDLFIRKYIYVYIRNETTFCFFYLKYATKQILLSVMFSIYVCFFYSTR